MIIKTFDALKAYLVDIMLLFSISTSHFSTIKLLPSTTSTFLKGQYTIFLVIILHSYYRLFGPFPFLATCTVLPTFWL
jgi:hypothetical protein